MVATFSCPSHKAMTALSQPDCSNDMAQVCLRTWGVGCLVRTEGRCWAAVAVCLATRHPTALRVSGAPRRVGNKGSSDEPRCSFIQRSHQGDGLLGERRAALLAPFPLAAHMRTGAELDVTDTQAGQLRDPEAGLHGNAEQDWSRLPVQVSRSGAPSKASTSSSSR